MRVSTSVSTPSWRVVCGNSKGVWSLLRRRRPLGAGVVSGPRPTIVIVADTRLYREGLATVLEQSGRIEVLGTAADGAAAVEAVWNLRPDMALLDMSIPSRAASVQAILETAPSVKVVGLAVPDAEKEVVACAEAGVSGLVTRDCTVDELVAAIESAARDELVCSPRMAGALLRRVAALSASTRRSESAVQTLTLREREIADLVACGLSNKEIAGELSIQATTVKNHVHRILEKMDAHRRAEIAARVGPWRRVGVKN
jgi:two-component system, NarL family, nitrate/nitrite response regulator NarL